MSVTYNRTDWRISPTVTRQAKKLLLELSRYNVPYKCPNDLFVFERVTRNPRGSLPFDPCLSRQIRVIMLNRLSRSKLFIWGRIRFNCLSIYNVYILLLSIYKMLQILYTFYLTDV